MQKRKDSSNLRNNLIPSREADKKSKATKKRPRPIQAPTPIRVLWEKVKAGEFSATISHVQVAESQRSVEVTDVI